MFNSESVDWITYGAEVRQQEYGADAAMADVVLNSVLGAGTLTTNLNYAWQDEFYNHSSEMTGQAHTTPAIGLMNARIAWFLAEQALTVAFGAANLTDEVYGRHHSKFARFFHGGPPGNRPNTENYAIFADRGPPRMIAFTLTKEFGNR